MLEFFYVLYNSFIFPDNNFFYEYTIYLYLFKIVLDIPLRDSNFWHYLF